jgi:hypothetical protein
VAFAHLVSTGAGASDTSTCNTSPIDTTGVTLLIAVAAWFAGVTSPAVMADNKGNTWVERDRVTDGSNVIVSIYDCVAPTVGTNHVFSLTGTTTLPSLVVDGWSGEHASSPFDQVAAGATATSTTIQPGSVTPTQNNELVVTGICSDTQIDSIDGSFVITTNIAGVPSTSFDVAAARLIQTSAAAANPTWTVNSSGGLRSTSVTYKSDIAGVAIPVVYHHRQRNF